MFQDHLAEIVVQMYLGLHLAEAVQMFLGLLQVEVLECPEVVVVHRAQVEAEDKI